MSWLVFIWKNKIINAEHDNNSFWIWGLWNSVEVSYCFAYIHQKLVEYNIMFYCHSIFTFPLKTLISKYYMRPNLINVVLSIIKNGIQSIYLSTPIVFGRWHKIFKFPSWLVIEFIFLCVLSDFYSENKRLSCDFLIINLECSLINHFIQISNSLLELNFVRNIHSGKYNVRTFL